MKNKNQEYERKSDYKITQKDLENPNRFIGEGLGAPEFKVKTEEEAKEDMEAFQNREYKKGVWNKAGKFLSKVIDYIGSGCVTDRGLINLYAPFSITPLIYDSIETNQDVH